MKPFLRVTFPNGYVFNVPVAVIVEDYATYHHRTDPARTLEQCASEARQMFDASEFALVDWAKNNMNWNDLAPHARMVAFRGTDLQRTWDDAELESIEAADQFEALSAEMAAQMPVDALMAVAANNELHTHIMVFTDPKDSKPFAVVSCALGNGTEMTALANALNSMANNLAERRRSISIEPSAVAPGSTMPS